MVEPVEETTRGKKKRRKHKDDKPVDDGMSKTISDMKREERSVTSGVLDQQFAKRIKKDHGYDVYISLL